MINGVEHSAADIACPWSIIQAHRRMSVGGGGRKMPCLFIFAGALFGAAALWPATWFSVIATWGFVLCLAWGAGRTESPCRSFFLAGFAFSALAFYWLPRTIVFFGGFPGLLAVVFFFIFCLTSALQFVLCAWIYRRLSLFSLLPKTLILPLAWFCSESLFPRLFPWMVANTQISWTVFASLASYAGVLPLGFLLFWWAEIGLSLSRCGSYRASRGEVFAGVLSFSLLLLGWFRVEQVLEGVSSAPRLRVSLVQGNLEAKQKGDERYFDVNLERYQDLSRLAISRGAELVIWPESVLNHWIGENRKVLDGELDPLPGRSVPLLFGGLSYRRQAAEGSGSVSVEKHAAEEFYLKRFNTAFGVTASGAIVGHYHKKVLMPFGEYVPFADRWPQLKEFSPNTGDFAVGDIDEPMPFVLSRADQGGSIEMFTARVASLICYEDLIPSLGLEAARQEAQLLVNLTNDAWYGNTAAQYQHHLLASWRAIETGRYLLRATNTGYTGIVDPLGKTIRALAPFTSGILVEDIRLMNKQTFYMRLGDVPAKTSALLILALSLFSVCSNWRGNQNGK